MPKSSQTFYCKQFLQSYQSQVAHDILELDLHQEEVQHSLTLFTTLYNREINSSVISHLQALHCRVIKITAKRRYLEALSDTLELPPGYYSPPLTTSQCQTLIVLVKIYLDTLTASVLKEN
jgi:hypothetical protein